MIKYRKSYATNTLLRMTKTELVEHIRCLESSIEVLEHQNDNQYKILMQLDNATVQEAYKKAHLEEKPAPPDCASCPIPDIACFEQCRQDEKRDVK